MNLKQISIFLENKPGHLQNVLEILSQKNINILTLTIAEVSDFGILRLLLNKPDDALAALKNANVTCSVTDVLGIAIDDKPGSLLKAIKCFKNNNLNIEYMYAFTEKRNDKAIMIFRFENIEKAKDSLQKEGYEIIKNSDIIEV